MDKYKDGLPCTDLEDLVDRSVNRMVKPSLIMSGCSEERIIKKINDLENLVIRKRLFYRKVVMKGAMTILLVAVMMLLTGC